jgi:hypothetical protein
MDQFKMAVRIYFAICIKTCALQQERFPIELSRKNDGGNLIKKRKSVKEGRKADVIINHALTDIFIEIKTNRNERKNESYLLRSCLFCGRNRRQTPAL